MDTAGHTAIADVQALEPDFEVLRELGRGTMGVVVLARRRDSGRLVAIKVVHPMSGDARDAEARVEREARTVARMQHPNIVRHYEMRRLPHGGIALVMQYVAGETLAATLRRTPRLSPEIAAQVLHDIALALQYAHGQNIVHRDVKPANIFIYPDTGAALLSDFGIAKSLEGEPDITLAGFAIGTPTYMSPEQLDGYPLDRRTDIYSLGVVGWEMLSGIRPWLGENLYGVIYKQKHQALPRLASLRDDVPARVIHALDGALEKDPSLRFGSMAEFLEQLADDAPTNATWRRHAVRGTDPTAAVSRAEAEPTVTIQFRSPPAPEPVAPASATPAATPIEAPVEAAAPTLAEDVVVAAPETAAPELAAPELAAPELAAPELAETELAAPEVALEAATPEAAAPEIETVAAAPLEAPVLEVAAPEASLPPRSPEPVRELEALAPRASREPAPLETIAPEPAGSDIGRAAAALLAAAAALRGDDAAPAAAAPVAPAAKSEPEAPEPSRERGRDSAGIERLRRDAAGRPTLLPPSTRSRWSRRTAVFGIAAVALLAAGVAIARVAVRHEPPRQIARADVARPPAATTPSNAPAGSPTVVAAVATGEVRYAAGRRLSSKAAAARAAASAGGSASPVSVSLAALPVMRFSAASLASAQDSAKVAASDSAAAGSAGGATTTAGASIAAGPAAAAPSPAASSAPATRAAKPARRPAVPDAGALALVRAERLLAARDYHQARTAADAAIAASPRVPGAYAVRARVRLQQGEIREAWADAEMAARLGDFWSAQAATTIVENRAGDTTSARRRVDDLLRLTDGGKRPLAARDRIQLAMAVAAVGDRARAVAVLERVDPSEPSLVAALQDPAFDVLRSSARFQAVAERARRTQAAGAARRRS